MISALFFALFYLSENYYYPYNVPMYPGAYSPGYPTHSHYAMHYPMTAQGYQYNPTQRKMKRKRSAKRRSTRGSYDSLIKKMSLTQPPITNELSIGDKKYDVTVAGGMTQVQKIETLNTPSENQKVVKSVQNALPQVKDSESMKISKENSEAAKKVQEIINQAQKVEDMSQPQEEEEEIEDEQAVENIPSQQVQTNGAGIRMPYPLAVGGFSISPLSYPFGVHLQSPGFRYSMPSYYGQPQVFDPDRQLYVSNTKSNVIDEEESFPFTSDHCDELSGEDKKKCMSFIPCSQRRGCLDCTFDFNCFYCSSTDSCLPKKFFGKDSFTGEHCPTSDIYYFQTCRVKSFVIMFFIIIFMLVLISVIVLLGFALMWRKSRRAKIYNIIKSKEDELNQTSYNDALVD